MTLKISLTDGETLVVNGAVIQAVGRTTLVLQNQAAILRGREIMRPDEATTPARRLYFACMMAYIDQESERGRHQDAIIRLLRELMDALESGSAKAACATFARRVALSDFYRALGDCRGLVDYEAEVLARVTQHAA